eukprot:TRINITY_DN2068_c0_g1_i4.p1 TRINITY_DN2068_c0_g1~~TRINITY_DN2068_c0_g1_i4.p1  ORF type:complete len:165 (+),score=33.42 TRINITY_DN2068_c0_g1_i4:76-570(+)
MLQTKALRERYVFHCDQNHRSPLLPLLRAMDDATTSGKPMQRLLYDGSADENRSKRMDDVDLMLISKALEDDESVRELIIPCNSITHKGVIHLARMLKGNQAITTLNLRSNSIDEEGVHELCQALESNNTLKRLNLNGNPIAKGALRIALLLEVSSTFFHIIPL